jgi:hypothetical protein
MLPQFIQPAFPVRASSPLDGSLSEDPLEHATAATARVATRDTSERFIIGLLLKPMRSKLGAYVHRCVQRVIPTD